MKPRKSRPPAKTQRIRPQAKMPPQPRRLSRERLVQLARAVEQSSIAVVITDTQGMIEYVNPALARHVPGLPSDLIGKPLLDLFWAEDHPLVQHVLEQKELGESNTHNVRIKARDANPIPVLINGVPRWRGKQVIGTIIVVTDLTARSHAEESLRRSEQYVRSIIDSSLDMIITVDNERRIVEFNRAAQETFGYSRDEVIGRHINILYANLEQSQSTHQAAISEETFVGEVANRRKNGEVFYSRLSTSPIRDAQGNPMGIVGVSRDVTEQRRIEEALRESEARNRIVVENLGEGIAFADLNERFTFANPAAEKIFDVPGGLVGRNLREFTTPEQFALIQSQTQRRAAGEKNSYELEIVRLNGEKRALLVTAAPWFDPRGQFVGAFGVFRDITERKQTEEALARHDAILGAVTYAAERFLRTRAWAEHIQEVMARLGQLTQVSRVYIFENQFSAAGVLSWRQRYEWVAPNVTLQIDNPGLRDFPVSAAGFSRWRALLEKGELIQSYVKDLPAHEQAALQAQGIRSIIIVPIFVQPAWWGFMGFDECRVEREWSTPETDALVAAASILGSAIERERGEQELRARVHHLGLLHEITNAALATSDLRQSLQTLADRLGELLAADGCYITLWDAEQQRTIPMAAYGTFREIYPTMIPQPGEVTMTASVLAASRPLVAEDVFNSPFTSPRIAAPFPTKSMLGLPLIAGDRKLGAALIAFNQPHHFTPDEIERGTQAAGQIALAIVQTQSLAAEQRRAAELEAIREASLSLTSTLNLPDVLDAILESVFQLAPTAQDTHIYLYANQQLLFGAARWADGRQGEQFAAPRSNGLTYTVAQRGEMIVVPDMRAHPLFKNAPPDWQGAIAGLPLKIANRVVGVMTVAYSAARHFPATELRVLDLLGAQAALAIENARLYQQVQQMAITDSLTGLYNRRGLMQLGKREVSRALRHNTPLTMILFDIDHFKQVNDTYGHYAGDKILVAIAERCQSLVRAPDILARYGGEEFVLLMPETNLKVAWNVAERLRQVVAAMSTIIDGVEIRVTISLGLAETGPRTMNLEQLIDCADQLQYRAKQAGRNRTEVFIEEQTGRGNAS